jgi:hypothetical protein
MALMLNDTALQSASKMNYYIIGESSKFSADTTPEFYYYSLFADSKLIGTFVHNTEFDTFTVNHSEIDIGDGKTGWLTDTVGSMAEAIRYIKQEELV